ncbi:MAG TPA: alpha/beta hydrolase [Flavobacteriaceae bacterium]|nr:alpha/beta hydrolase [Flavobacteriaceae bacterium]
MKSLPRHLLSLSFFIFIFSCTTDNNNNNPDTLPLEFYQELNISYGNDSDQVFDIYLPENRTNQTKTIILVHGGGWVSGDKNDMNAFKDLLLQQHPDIAIVNMNYRLADQNTPFYPTQINDITSVVDYLKNQMSTYTISDDIGFIGTSAGAHLSLLWSYAFDFNSHVKMVCSVVGPTNFTDPAYLENTDPLLQELLDVYGQNPTTEYLEEISPYHQVMSSAPPTILFYGGMDPLVPTSQGTAMRDKLLELEVPHEFTLYENEAHGWVGVNLIDTTIKLNAFINNYF